MLSALSRFSLTDDLHGVAIEDDSLTANGQLSATDAGATQTEYGDGSVNLRTREVFDMTDGATVFVALQVLP